jgi:hypothetical protein
MILLPDALQDTLPLLLLTQHLGHQHPVQMHSYQCSRRCLAVSCSAHYPVIMLPVPAAAAGVAPGCRQSKKSSTFSDKLKGYCTKGETQVMA